MIEGKIYKLEPFKKKNEEAERSTKREIRAIFAEDVVFIRLCRSDNAVVRDMAGRLRRCNPEDMYEEIPN